jgi:C4-dicarboxylate transporter/malic acid transport protein
METTGTILSGSGARPSTRRRALFGELERPSDVFAHLGPNWFASVMGTGIVANAAILLPRQVPGQHAFALVVWVLAALLLVLVLGATAIHWVRHTATARGHALDPAMAPFYGAPPMAFMTVGAGTLLVGHDVIGMRAAVAVDLTLWTLGTLGGLLASAAVPYLMFTRHELTPESTFGSWLMPVVPPMVSAATGAALIAHVPAGQARLSLLLACYAMFGLSLVASLITITLVWSRLAYHHVGPARLVPTLWIVLGPLGQSITAANLLANVAPGIIREPYATTLQATGILYGVPVWGFAALWFAIAAAITIRTARAGLPFSLTWWSFTFPVGTFVTGTSELATHSGSGALAWIAVALYVFLLAAWVTVATRTVRNSLAGRLFLPPAAVVSPA